MSIPLGGGGSGAIRFRASNVGAYSAASRKAATVVSPALENAAIGVFFGRSATDGDLFNHTTCSLLSAANLST